MNKPLRPLNHLPSRHAAEPLKHGAVRQSALQPKPAVPHPQLTAKGNARMPVAPPVYRPQPASKTLQTQTARAAQNPRQPKAPHVYRPQPLPQILQQKKVAGQPPQSSVRGANLVVQRSGAAGGKTAPGQQSPTSQSPHRSVAPPAYRPMPGKAVQGKMPPLKSPRHKHDAGRAMTLQRKTATPGGTQLHNPGNKGRAGMKGSPLRPSKTIQRSLSTSAYENPLGLSDQHAYDPNKRTFHRRSSFDYIPPSSSMEVEDDAVPTIWRIGGSALHKKLCSGLSGGLNENFVALGMSLVWRAEIKLETNTQTSSTSWESGGEKPSQFNQMLKTVGHTGAVTPEKVWHSEQQMVFQLGQENGNTLFTLLKHAITGVPTGSELLLVILEVHSHVRGICNNCARTLKSLITSLWIREAEAILFLMRFDTSNLKFVLRTSADEYFSGGGASGGQVKAQKQPKDTVATYGHDGIPDEHHQLPWNL